MFMDSMESMSSGMWHNGFTEEIADALQRAALLCHELNQSPPTETSGRERLLHQLLGSVGIHPHVNSPFRCDIGTNITVGDNFMCNFNVAILDEAQVTIGANVFIGPNSTICTVTHALLPYQRNAGVMKALPINIGSNVWFGAGVTVMPGVTIGDGAVIGAGSLVTRDIPGGVLAYGSPCRVIREITEDDKVDGFIC